jgi:hypothetical protein
MRRSTFAPILIALVLAVPGVAYASNVSLVGGTPPDGVPTFRAAPGEINDLKVTQEHQFFFTFEDVAFMIAGKGCSAVAFTSVQCTSTKNGVEVYLKDGDDKAHWAISGYTKMWGGGGNDDIGADSYTAFTEIYGEGGNDRVSSGGEGNQIADGGPGADTVLCCGAFNHGTALGGSGDDLIKYSYQGAGSANIDAGTGDDTVTARPPTEPSTATGGDGDDIIVVDGTVQPPSTGAPFELAGGDGDDTIVGGPETDAIDAGPGRDYVDVRGGGVDTVECGEGMDIVRFDASDTIAPDCETQLP